MDAEQYYQSIQRHLPADHATLQGWKQENRKDNEWGTEEDLLWEDTWKGTKDTFLEAAAQTYPRPPEDIRQGLHAFLAFHSWNHRHTITLHPLDHNPQRWTPEDDATAAITVQQSPENPEEYHITWNDPAPHPPASPTLPDVFATISAKLQEAKAPQQPDEEMPQAPSPPTTQESPRTRDTRVAEPWLPAPEDGRPGEGQRLTPGAPHNGGRPPPSGTAPHRPRGTQPPQGMQAKGTALGPHTPTPAPQHVGGGPQQPAQRAGSRGRDSA